MLMYLVYDDNISFVFRCCDQRPLRSSIVDSLMLSASPWHWKKKKRNAACDKNSFLGHS